MLWLPQGYRPKNRRVTDPRTEGAPDPHMRQQRGGKAVAMGRGSACPEKVKAVTCIPKGGGGRGTAGCGPREGMQRAPLRGGPHHGPSSQHQCGRRSCQEIEFETNFLPVRLGEEGAGSFSCGQCARASYLRLGGPRSLRQKLLGQGVDRLSSVGERKGIHRLWLAGMGNYNSLSQKWLEAKLLEPT